MSQKMNLSTHLDPEHMRRLLFERFASAGIPLEWAESPLEFDRNLRVRAGASLFMLDVRRRLRKKHLEEYILIHYGNGTEVNVLGVDRKQQQVVLRAYEPKANLQRVQWDRRLKRFTVEEHVVQEVTRRLLVGMDERHLFVCPLNQNASSVGEAHRKLVPASARQKRTKRQGEWFFVPVETPDALEEIARIVDLVGATRRQPIQTLVAGRPHIVDERVQVGESIYVRGRVRHPDHHVLKLNGWHEVHLNNENRAARIEGMRWVD